MQLAGGRSSSMVKDKALLALPGGQVVHFVEHLASVLVACCSEVVIVARDQAHAAGYSLPGVRTAYDKVPDYGPLMGLYSGLSAIHTSHALVVAVDMPFVQPALLSLLLTHVQALDTHTLLIPLVNNVPQVLLPVYPRSILPSFYHRLPQRLHNLLYLLEAAHVQYIEEAQLREVDPQLRSFINVNTLGELREMM